MANLPNQEWMGESGLRKQENRSVTTWQPKQYSRTFKAGLLASGQFLQVCATLGSLMVLARVLTVQGYATYRQSMLAYQFAAPLLALGLPQALYYFLPGETRRVRAILLENLLLLSGMATLFPLILLLGGNKLLAWRFHNPGLSRTLLILAPYSLLTLPTGALTACLVARDRVKQVVVFHVLSRLCIFVSVVGASIIWRTPAAALTGTVLGAGLLLFPALRLMLAACNEGERWPTAAGMRAQLTYSVPIGLAGLAGITYVLLDKMVVSSMCTSEEFAVYVNGAVEVPLIGLVTGSVTAVLLPSYVKFFRAGNMKGMAELWKSAMVKCSTIIFPLTVILFITAPELMTVLFSARYVESANVFRIYLLMMPFRVASYSAVLRATGRTSWLLIWEVASLTGNLLLTILFVYLFGYIGAATSTVAVSIVSFIVILVVFRRIFRTPPLDYIPLGRLSKVSLCALCCVPVLYGKVLLPDSALLRLVIIYPIAGVVACIALAGCGLLRLHGLKPVLLPPRCRPAME